MIQKTPLQSILQFCRMLLKQSPGRCISLCAAGVSGPNKGFEGGAAPFALSW